MILKDTNRKKLINAILYFTHALDHPTKTNIFKMLYFSDIKHFKDVGRSISRLEYFAWDHGPVPKRLYEEMKNDQPPEDMRKFLSTNIELDEFDENVKKVSFIARKKPDMNVFSKREKNIIEEVAFTFKHTLPGISSEITHTDDPLWRKTIKDKGMYEKMDYLMALDNDAKIDMETAIERLELSSEMQELFGA